MGASPQGGKRAGRKASMSALAKRAVIDSFAKLTPREQAKNPVMLMVYISAILTLGLPKAPMRTTRPSSSGSTPRR